MDYLSSKTKHLQLKVPAGVLVTYIYTWTRRTATSMLSFTNLTPTTNTGSFNQNLLAFSLIFINGSFFVRIDRSKICHQLTLQTFNSEKIGTYLFNMSPLIYNYMPMKRLRTILNRLSTFLRTISSQTLYLSRRYLLVLKRHLVFFCVQLPFFAEPRWNLSIP